MDGALQDVLDPVMSYVVQQSSQVGSVVRLGGTERLNDDVAAGSDLFEEDRWPLAGSRR
jgi:hypothetical protein